MGDTRLAGTTWTARDLPLEDALDVIREAGLTTVELWADGVHLDPRAFGFRPAAARRVMARGPQAVSVHLPFHAVSPAASADIRATDWVALCTETLHQVAEFGPRIAVAHPVIYEDPGEPAHNGGRRLVRAMRGIAECASGLGMRLAVENMHDLRGRTLRSVAEIAAVLPAVGQTAGLCLDVGHAIFNGYLGPRLGDEVRAAGPQLLSTHVHDSDRVGADPHLLPGDGIADWPAFASALNDIDYHGRFILEINSGSDPVDRLVEARARFSATLHSLRRQPPT